MSSSNIVESMGTENSQKPMPRIMGLAICLPCIAIFLILVGALCYSIIQIDAHMPKTSSTAQSSN
ncbi:MAG: hypothetical protein UU40_C0012G0026 [Candidatus Uhrbacteria bacterium GW2011_GWD2_41_121]|uniref:Uncharacterized protein n=1 Tax=Candidatus Uhrbacteria bacterium GW2011_GWC1_41_20 TaxID=1618983 RepID=A0A0G0VDA0_9BACT|nr:MAG: hypothetical protein UT52_C0004G0026 [Candidatus Uhrbacteria bacterium GW2011_GWE1_39_46]KKR63779.1 MAG: hypothetical protein UU04_C0012G0017 [Candidatus Uhrbacteria bacterium GW2011_GWC2_40_450]KKR89918.1 MAG: hypothetical protein UU40_C0012G0026 [Candidatus Uhrbacteria bacterium GW2011_GWD2_41_121]KKR95788.1 MAG: hypothetical protein UU46_C0014G0026 [Candidatus Uhrbacteria bacterium GW2011_GWD1_41_16]KKR98869.1 MAG: hypothetical protein UU50_C0014G0001 [Candidatus Uhrbacteria bacteriu